MGFNWLEHDKKKTTVELDYKSLKEIEYALSERIKLLEPHWAKSNDPVDRHDFVHLKETKSKILNAMFRIDTDNPVSEKKNG